MQKIESPDSLFHEGNPLTGELGTIVSANWLNSVQSELVALVEGQGAILDPNTKNQIAQLLFKTQPQFDASKKLATDEFVQRALGNYSGAAYYPVSTQLSGSDAGKVLTDSGAGVALTLPSGLAIALGTAFTFIASASLTIKTKAGDTFIGGATSISLGLSDNLTVVYAGNSIWWPVSGSAVLGSSASFQSLKSANGYQKLPGGLIMQWGQIFSANFVNTNLTFPIAFPNACLSVTASGMQSAGNTQAYVTTNSRSQVGAVFNCFVANSGVAPALAGAGAVQVWWIAVGY